jgi:hypothetical protein
MQHELSQLAVYGLFNDATNSSEHISSNGRDICEQWIGKDLEGSGGALFQGIVAAICWRKTTAVVSDLWDEYWTRNSEQFRL